MNRCGRFDRPCGGLGIVALLRSLVLLIGLVAATPVYGQTAPAGNAHPTSEPVTRADGSGLDVRSPFGVVTMDGRPAGIDAKLALSRAVDLSPMKNIAVWHDGRIKILDTLATETVLQLTGKRHYEDLIPVDGRPGVSRKESYPAIFTLLDLIIDPQYYFDKPLVYIEYLPLRKAIMVLALPTGAPSSSPWDTPVSELSNEQSRWVKLTRVAPQMIQDHVPGLMEKVGMRDGFSRALAELDRSLSLWGSSASNMMLVAPDRTDLPWTHISALPVDHPARRAAIELGAAWRAGDAAKVNTAVKMLAGELPKVNPALYPAFKRSLETVYNAARPFEYGYWGYLVATISLLLAFGTGRAWLRWLGLATLLLAVSFHAFGFISRCIIAERFAIQNQFESMTGISLFAAIVGLGLMIFRRQWIFGAAAAGVGFLLLITASTKGIPGMEIEKEAAILNTSVLLKYHVTTVLVSYGLISLGFIISLFYLGTHYLTRLAPAGGAARVQTASGPMVAAAALGMDGEDADPAGVGRERVLADLDRAHMIVLQIAFWTLGVGILLGAWWADHSWGRWWAFDPKETWALATWIIYLIVIHVRLTQTRNKPLKTAWLSVLGFGVMLWTYFGVNLLLPGLHAYA